VHVNGWLLLFGVLAVILSSLFLPLQLYRLNRQTRLEAERRNQLLSSDLRS
jgi:preprotein translocase subunit SecF